MSSKNYDHVLIKRLLQFQNYLGLPSEIEVIHDDEKYLNLPELKHENGRGGWTDPKDHSQCKAMLKHDKEN